MQNLKLDSWQKDFLNTEGNKILCTGRQVGKSVTCGIDAGRYALNNGNKRILMIAPTERQAFELFSKTLDYIYTKNSRMIKRGKDRPTKSKINLKNGTRILCLPTGTAGMGIRGYTVDRLYMDEASRVPEDVWGAVTPMLLTTGGNMILLSTPFGAQGEFYRVWINRDDAYRDFKRFSANSEEVIRNRPICSTWTQKQREMALNHIEQEKKRKSKREYAQEYLGEFIEDLHRFFSDELIAKTCILKRPETISSKSDYYMGCDIARMGEDEGTFEIIKKINRDNLIHVENIVTKKKLTTETEDKILKLDKQYNFKNIYIDAGAGTLGVSIFDHLLAKDQTKRKIVALSNQTRPIDKEGKKSKKLLKEDLYNNLLALMEQNRIKLLDDEDVIESLRSVQYEYIQKTGYETKLRIFGTNTHITEGLIRGAWCVKEKDLNIWVTSIRI